MTLISEKLDKRSRQIAAQLKILDLIEKNACLDTHSILIMTRK
ncbi:MAG: hypothetical protein RMY28_024840 [Nostoc sp. ChiSLP01]|nr:hypothetical protein [Nostoc sp. CmiSLP01]MDZ8237947.1 hypothetical protein [Nostoc sp. ChiQUE01a]MDZ8282664.1 hypothetical protein [Nostoc sp. ChiSLP01]